MENKKIVLLKWVLCQRMAQISFLWWFMETLYFIVEYGWHLKAINNSEQLCDDMFGWGMSVSALLFLSVLVDIVQYLLSERK